MASPSANRTSAPAYRKQKTKPADGQRLYSPNEKLRAREISLKSVVEKRLKLERDGALFRAPCPFHNEKTPSFKVDPRKNTFYCYGCGAHGDVIQFVMDHDKLTFHEALEHLIGPPGSTGQTAAYIPRTRSCDQNCPDCATAASCDALRSRLHREAEDAKEREKRVKGAQKEALGISPLDDPRAAPAVRYLVEQRGAETAALAEAAARSRYGKDIGFHPDFHPSDKSRFVSWPALCAVLRDDTGQITAVQGTKLDLETCRAIKKDGKTVRLTRGVMTGACVRIPGIEPSFLKPILTDGLDKGIIANLATGRPVLVGMGGIPRLCDLMPDGSAFTISVDHDFKPIAPGKVSPSTILATACGSAHARNCRVTLISPAIRFAEDETFLKTDWDDVARQVGLPQVAAEIDASGVRWLPPGPWPVTGPATEAAPDRFADALEELANQESLDLPLGEAALAEVASQICAAMEEIRSAKAAVADLDAARTAATAAYKVAAALRRSFRGLKGKDAQAGRAEAREASKAALGAAKAAKAAHSTAAAALATDTASAWVRLINATLGAGKSRMIGEIITRLPPTLSIGVVVSDRTRIDETTAALSEAVVQARLPHRVIPIYGRDQLVAGLPMCQKADIAHKVQANGKSIQGKLCKSVVEDDDGNKTEEVCPFFNTCLYQSQMADKDPAIRVFAHSYLQLTTGSPLPPFDLIFIDEDFTKALTHKGDYKVPLTVISEVQWIADAMVARALAASKKNKISRKTFEEIEGDKQSIIDYTNRLFCVLNSPDPTPAKVKAAGITAANAKYMADMWYSAVADLEITPAMPEDLQLKTLEDYQCGIGYKCARLWRIIEKTLECQELDKQNVIPGLDIVTSMTEADRQEKTVRMLWSTTPTLECPVVILDGTANRHKAAQFYAGLTETRIKIKPQFTRLIQLFDRPLSKSALGYGLGKGEFLKAPRDDEKTRAKNQRSKAARLFEVLAATAPQPPGLNPAGDLWDRVAVIAQMDIGEAIRSEHPHLAELGVAIGYEREDGKRTGHHGASRGTNIWEQTPILCALGRNLPPREALEREARAIWWNDPTPWTLLGPGIWDKKAAWIRVKGEGKCPVQNPWHPDYRVRILLDQYLRAELEQEIHRVRPIRRTAANPCTIYVCTDIATSLEVDDVTTWDELVPDEADLMVARGIIPSDWHGRSQVLKDLFLTVANPAAALRNRAHYDADLGRRFAAASNPSASVRSPNIEPSIGLSDGTAATYTAYRYRVLGRDKGGYLLIANSHENHLDAAEARLGRLDRLIEIPWEQYVAAIAEFPEPDEDPVADGTVGVPEPPPDWLAETSPPDEAYVGFVVDYAECGPPDPWPD